MPPSQLTTQTHHIKQSSAVKTPTKVLQTSQINQMSANANTSANAAI
jgi:hypothetical protein